MPIQKEIWQNQIKESLYKDNAILNCATNADEFVLEGKIVHIPQAGVKPEVVLNRTSYPAVVATRTDTDITYALNELTTTPTRIPNADTIELSYDKLNSVLANHNAAIRELIAEYLIQGWCPSGAGSIIRTSSTTAVPAHLTDATGNRNKFSYQDLRRAQILMNKANVSKLDRFCLVDSDMFGQLMDDADLLRRDYGKELDMVNGVVARLFGFNIIERASTAVYTNASTPAVKAVGAAGAATDNGVALCFQKGSVERAIGEVRVFESTNDPLYYGDVYSALVRFGGRISRSDQAGVIAIVQSAAA